MTTLELDRSIAAGPKPATAEVHSPAAHTKVRRLFGRYWATISLLAAIVAAAVVTGALWRGVLPGSDLYRDVAYGLPALREGRWWTTFLGAFFAPHVILFIPILALLGVTASVYERRVGHWRTLLLALGGQFLATIGAAALIALLQRGDWAWTNDVGAQLDLGISAGGFVLLGALTAVMQPVWRLRVRVAVGAYLIAMVLMSGLIWDVEHIIGFAIGVVVGPLLVRRPLCRPQVHFGARTQRSTVALIVAVTAVSRIVEAGWPGNGGPFHMGNVAEHSSAVTLSFVVTSVLMLATADSLRRGRRVAWVFVTVLTSVNLVIGTWSASSGERNAQLVLTTAQLILLLGTAASFSARTRPAAFRRAGRRLAWVAGFLLLYTAAGFGALQHDFSPVARPADMITEFLYRLTFSSGGAIEPATTASRWFVGSIGTVWLVALATTAIGIMASCERPVAEPDQDERLRTHLREYPSSDIAWMSTWRGTTAWWSQDGQTAIGFRVVGSVALCLADPIGPIERREDALREFDEHCFKNGWTPCLFAASGATAVLASSLGWRSVEVAENSVVQLGSLEFRGKAWQDVRTALNHAAKQGITLRVARWSECSPVITDQLRAISGEWVSDKALPEMGFTLGTLREAHDDEVRLHLAVREDGTIEGFTSWLPVFEHGQIIGWTLDLMRHRQQGFRPVMEFLIASSAVQFQLDGYRFMSLSAAPLATPPEVLAGGGDRTALQRVLDLLAVSLEPSYGFQSLFKFKQKFQPEHDPMYLVFPDETALAEIGVAIARAYVPDAGLRDWVAMGWETYRPHHDEPHHEELLQS
jgi:phosphatidylglycerol lysyltransferase